MDQLGSWKTERLVGLLENRKRKPKPSKIRHSFSFHPLGSRRPKTETEIQSARNLVFVSVFVRPLGSALELASW